MFSFEQTRDFGSLFGSQGPKTFTQRYDWFGILDPLFREVLPRPASGGLDSYPHLLGELIYVAACSAEFHGSGIALDHLLQNMRRGDSWKVGTAGGRS